MASLCITLVIVPGWLLQIHRALPAILIIHVVYGLVSVLVVGLNAALFATMVEMVRTHNRAEWRDVLSRVGERLHVAQPAAKGRIYRVLVCRAAGILLASRGYLAVNTALLEGLEPEAAAARAEELEERLPESRRRIRTVAIAVSLTFVVLWFLAIIGLTRMLGLDAVASLRFAVLATIGAMMVGSVLILPPVYIALAILYLRYRDVGVERSVR
jgi:hypothetical protein